MLVAARIQWRMRCMDEVTEKLAVDAAVTFEDYEECDDEACTSAELTTEDIVHTVRRDDGTSDEDAESDDGDAKTGRASQAKKPCLKPICCSA
ncbi:hypothetical protein HPB48_019293 [Haemaphysalis longicornis]|uniref:Uncharacterized protein n=1 Tax=Haemaphysalis longicornis TaxID=44386 RepID=A0A9J6GDC2_HAELO|nr:hypothetical protein HPB48_019293 [Haemaphysalis longicornis]